MTFSIAFVLGLLGVAIVLFVTEWLRVDLVAFLALLILAVTGIITHDEALAGFSNRAVVTIASVLVLSAGLVRTGVAQLVGHQIMRLAGESEFRLLLVMMATVGIFSGVMNNIGVAALLLPVIMDIAKRTQTSPSRLLMPLAFASLLGGLTTLIATAPNILISNALEVDGFAGFKLFDFLPVGGIALVVGLIYMATLGKRLLPERVAGRENTLNDMLTGQYALQKRLKTLTIPEGSPLTGKNLIESRLGSALGFNVIAIIRNEQSLLAPSPTTELQERDKLLVEGRRQHLNTLQNWNQLELERGWLIGEHQLAAAIQFAEVKIVPGHDLVGKTLKEAGFRLKWNINILAVKRGDHVKFSKLRNYRLHEDDILVAMGAGADLARVKAATDAFRRVKLLKPRDVAFRYRLHRQVMGIRIPDGSELGGKTLAESRLKDALGINVLGINRQGELNFLPSPDFELAAGDVFIVLGQPQNLDILDGLQHLILEEAAETDLSHIESDEVGVAEIALTPRTRVVGKTIEQLHFRDKYGLTVLAIWRGDRAYRTNLRDMALQPGDALLVYGERRDLSSLQKESDFLVLIGADAELADTRKAPIAGGIEIGVLVSVAAGWLPIYIAAPLGAALMVLTRCLKPDEAYRAIEWKAIILIAGMLGVGIALESSGAAELLAQTVLAAVGGLGTYGIIAGLYLITAIAAQIMPTAAVAVIMAPLAIRTAIDMGMSPHALAMVVVLGSSSSFLSPVGHPVNLLVMGLGGYRFTDYTRVGLPLVFLLLLIALFVLPVFWPLH